MTEIQLMKKQNLIDSVIALEQQARRVQKAIEEDVQRWAGQSPREALKQTAKAMLYDVGKLQDLLGADEWSESKRQFALALLSSAI